MAAESRYRRLLDPVDRGDLTLPADVLTARATVHRLTAAQERLTPPAAAHVPRDAAVRAALQAEDPASIDVSEILDHDRHVAEHTHRRQTLSRALETADRELAGALEDHTARIITHHVRPAGQKLWTLIAKAVAALDGIELVCVDTMLRAPDKARRAYLQLDALAGQYARLREAWSPLPEPQPVQHDTHGDHAEFQAGLCTIIGPSWRGSPMSPHRPQPPWPDDPRGRLIWLVRRGHTPWWPLAPERDEAWLAVPAHREAHTRVTNQQRRGRQVHAQWAQTG